MEDLKYQEYIREYFDLNKEFMGNTILQDQESKLFKDGVFSKKFPNDKDLINYELKNKHINKTKIEYEETRKDEIQDALNVLIAMYENSADLEATKVMIGATFWDKNKTIQAKYFEVFKEAIEQIVKSF